MEIQIQDLVSSIKKEGVDAARKEADGILAEARSKAEALLADAKAEAKKTLENAEKEIALLKESAGISAKQAQRDAMLSFKSEVQGEFEKILSADVKKTMSSDALGKLIAAALADEDPAKYSAEVAEVTDALKQELADKVKNGLEIKASKEVKSGFRLALKDGSGYFDCSDEEITKMLMPFFSNLSF